MRKFLVGNYNLHVVKISSLSTVPEKMCWKTCPPPY